MSKPTDSANGPRGAALAHGHPGVASSTASSAAPSTVSSAVSSLVAFVADTRYERLPAAAVARAKCSILDAIGCGIYGAGIDTAAPFFRYVSAQGGAPQSAVWMSGTRTTAFYAALMNATYVHATEISETYIRAVVHPGNVIIPALLALGERHGSRGADLLTATVVGYESLIRFGFSVGRPFMIEQGLHSFSVMGVFGSTVAASKLLNFDKGRVANALGIAACQTPTPLIIAATEGAMIKEIFEGYASALGVMCTDLAEAGIIGVNDWAKAWYAAVPRKSDIGQLAKGLGETWLIAEPGLRIKMRPVMGMVQPTVEAVYDLIADRPIDYRQIESIRVETTQRAFIAGNKQADSLTAARVSIPFMTAAVLVRQKAVRKDPYLLRFIQPELLADANIAALADKVSVAVDDEMEYNFEESPQMKYESRVRLRMASGEEIVTYKDIWPATSAMTYEQVAGKFRACVSGAIPDAHAERIVDTVASLERLEDVSTLVDLLKP